MGEIDKIFGLMDSWPHLPSYQLERCADIFSPSTSHKLLKKSWDIQYGRGLGTAMWNNARVARRHNGRVAK